MTISWKGKNVCVDEKIKNKSSINEPFFPYPSVEILPNAEYTSLSGWWVNPNEKTDIYCYINISADNTDWNTLSYDDITQVEVVMFGRKNLKEWQYQHVGTDEDIYRDAVELADSYNDRKNYYNMLNEKTAHLKKTTKGRQHPVNLVFSLQDILNVKGTKHLIITKNGVSRL